MKLPRRLPIFEDVEFDITKTGREDWDKILTNPQNKEDFHIEIINISPEEYLKRVQAERFTSDDSKVEKYVQELQNAKNVPVPTMWFSDKSQYDLGFSPSWHDGSHRAKALQKLGYDSIPVMIIY